MSDILEHLDDIANECRVMYDDGHFENTTIAKGIPQIMLIIKTMKNMIEPQNKENKNERPE